MSLYKCTHERVNACWILTLQVSDSWVCGVGCLTSHLAAVMHIRRMLQGVSVHCDMGGWSGVVPGATEHTSPPHPASLCDWVWWTTLTAGCEQDAKPWSFPGAVRIHTFWIDSEHMGCFLVVSAVCYLEGIDATMCYLLSTLCLTLCFAWSCHLYSVSGCTSKQCH